MVPNRLSCLSPMMLVALCAPGVALAEDQGQPCTCVAQDVSSPSVELEADLTLFSDFRRGGISLTNGGPALQFNLEAAHANGLHGGVFASNIRLDGTTRAEIDLSAGYARDVAGVEVDLGAIYYVIPGVSGTDYIELQASFGRSVGPVDVSLGFAWTPSQVASGHQTNLYSGVDAEWAVTDSLSLYAAVGRENGAFGDHKLDWSTGVTVDWAGFQWGAAYADSHRAFAPHAAPTLIFSLSKGL